ncbi:MAG: SAM-dependent methyltransferase [Gaiellales bacterium]
MEWLTSSKARRHSKVGPIRMWEEKRAFQIDFLLHEAGLRPEQHLLDLGCGTLRGGIPIIQHLEAGGYTGIEARPEVLEDARRELRDHNLEHKRPVLMACDQLDGVDLDRRFDVVWSFAVLIHMSDDVLDAALRFVRRHLGDDGDFYANVNVERRRDTTWVGFPNVARPITFYTERAAEAGLTVEDLGTLASLGHAPGMGEHQHMLRMAPAWRTTPRAARRGRSTRSAVIEGRDAPRVASNAPS